MFSRRTLSLLVVLSLVAQVMVLTNTEERTSNFVEDEVKINPAILGDYTFEFRPWLLKR